MNTSAASSSSKTRAFARDAPELGAAHSLPRLVVIAGPTAAGKSDLALRFAERIGGEIVNFDSVQIYRGFDIGSAKPSAADRDRIPHHLIDICDADEEFDAARFVELASSACNDIAARSRTPILAGGTGFYLRALLSGLPHMPGRSTELRNRMRRIRERPRGAGRLWALLERVDPATATRLQRSDTHRIERALEVWLASGSPISAWERPGPIDAASSHVLCALRMPREQLTARIEERVDRMYSEGLLGETQRLLEQYGPDVQPLRAIGYREAVRLLQGEIVQEAAIAETKRRTRAYAKRQMTWLRAERAVHWLDADRGADDALAEVESLLQIRK